mgnify:CR=1 FL=1
MSPKIWHVYIYIIHVPNCNKCYIVLRPDDVDLAFFFEVFVQNIGAPSMKVSSERGVFYKLHIEGWNIKKILHKLT